MIQIGSVAHKTEASGVSARFALDECRQKLRAAERELGAFMKAVQDLFGSAVAREAARIWVETLDISYSSTSNGHPTCREITIRAASELADQLISRRSMNK